MDWSLCQFGVNSKLKWEWYGVGTYNYNSSMGRGRDIQKNQTDLSSILQLNMWGGGSKVI